MFLKSQANNQYLQKARLCRSLVNFAHVPVVYGRNLAIVPGDGDCIPAGFGDDAAIRGIAPPVNPGARLEALRFINGHCASPFQREEPQRMLY